MTSRGESLKGHGSTRRRDLHTHIDEWELLAVDYLDGRLSPEDKDAVEAHLAGCTSCSARMDAQQGIVTHLQRADRIEAPDDLEDRVLGELLFPTAPNQKPAFRGIDVERRSKRPGFRGRFRPLIPVTGMVLALFIGIVVLGTMNERSEPTVAEETGAITRTNMETAETPADGVSQGPPETLTTATAAGAPTATSAPVDTGEGTGQELTPASISPEIRDKRAMIETMDTAGGVLYLAFEAPPGEKYAGAPDAGDQTSVTLQPEPAPSNTVPLETASQVAAQITGFTQLEQLPPDLSMGGPTFAAHVALDDIQPFLDLLFSIEASLGVDLVLRLEPAVGYEANADAIVERMNRLPVVVADRLPQPSVSQFTFTTSTLVPAGQIPTEAGLPHTDGLHLLVVIYVAR